MEIDTCLLFLSVWLPRSNYLSHPSSTGSLASAALVSAGMKRSRAKPRVFVDVGGRAMHYDDAYSGCVPMRSSRRWQLEFRRPQLPARGSAWVFVSTNHISQFHGV